MAGELLLQPAEVSVMCSRQVSKCSEHTETL
jgi:hypothetical protein